MSYNTVTTWNPLPTPEQMSAVINKANEMMSQGYTDGTYQAVRPNGQWEPPRIITRTWTTIEAAQEWKTFCEAVTPVAPESVEILG